MKDLVDYSKQHPEQVTYATVGTGTAGHIAGSFIEAKEKVKWRMIPYAGSADVLPAVLGGHADLGMLDVSLVIGHLKTGVMRILAIEKIGKEKYSPDVVTSTFEELGYEIPVGATFGIIAPKGTPAEIIKKLHDAFKKTIEDPRYEEHCEKLGVLRAYRSGEEFFRIIKEQYEVRGKVLKALGLAKKK
jgi:tripartite-type tricarboxylate transporter receptor subunit TctC